MATPDWEAIESAYRAGVMSLRDIGAQYGVSEGAIRKKAKKLEWVRNGGTQVRKSGTQKPSRTLSKPAASGDGEKYAEGKAEHSPETKPEPVRKKVVTNYPPFQPGNQHALKHGGYARRLLLSDEVIEDAKALSLEDELFRLRASNLVAAENIGRWVTKLEDEEESQQRKVLMESIGAAEKAMMRNTVRIESIVGTLATVGKIFADTDYRKAATDKVSLEADRLRRDAGIDDGNGERDLNDFYSDMQTNTESGPEKLLDDSGA
jgi:hypothetical protein